MKIFVGYDPREHACFQVMEYTLNEFGHDVIPIRHRDLRIKGKFRRPWFIDEHGQFHDQKDLKPFSTEFSHARFAAFPMAREMGEKDWCLFVDCDFLFLEDPIKMLEFVGKKDVLACVQYDWRETEGKKMDNMLQLLYHRKLWSSMFLFKPDDSVHDWMSWHRLNWATGAEMHAFSWVPDELCEKISPAWNYIPTYTDPSIDPKAVHWSYGGPWMPGYAHIEYADLWRDAYDKTLIYMVENEVARNPELTSHGRIV